MSNVSVGINGNVYPITKGAYNKYVYSFTPTSYKDYALIITVMYNDSGSSLFNKMFKITR
jgi:hypothetical protein